MSDLRCNSARSELDSSYTHVGHNRPNDGVACLFRLRPSRARQKLDTAGRNDADTAGRNNTDTAGRNDADTAGRNNADYPGGMTQKNSGTF